MIYEFEDVLLLVGSYGKYQKLMVFLVLVPTSFFISFLVNILLFQTVVPENYWCDTPGRDSNLYTKEEWWNLTIPRLKNGHFEKCLQYQINTENETIYINDEITEVCSTGWEHNRLVIQESMATSMMWLCEKEIYSTHVFSANLAGNAVGTFLLPIIADKYTGRRRMFFISCVIHVIFNVPLLARPSYGIAVALRFFSGLAFQANYQMPYVIGLELTCPNKRAVVSFYSFVAWTIGMCFTALLAWLVPHWWYTVIISSVVSLLFFCYWSFLPESPRWLLSKGEIPESTNILLKIARINKMENVERKTVEKMLTSLAIQDHRRHLNEFLKYKKVFRNCLLMVVLSFCMFMGYGCVVYNVKILPENIYLSFFVVSLSELPSNILGYLSVHYLGRRFTGIASSTMTILFCLLATFFIEYRIALLIIVSLIKIFITQGVYLIYVATSEIFPTPVRSTGMGIVTLAGLISLIFAPYIVAASKGGSLQYWITIALCLAGTIFSFLLPETLGLPLPQTFDEADLFWRKRPQFKWIHHWNEHLYRLDAGQQEEPQEIKNLKAHSREQSFTSSNC